MEKHIQEIRKASFGKDAREPIAEALKCLQEKLISENSEVKREIMEARYGYSSLNDKLSDFSNQMGLPDIEHRINKAGALLKKKMEG